MCSHTRLLFAASCADAEGDDISIATIQDYAENYRLEGDGQLHTSCQHNAAVARRNKCLQVI